MGRWGNWKFDDRKNVFDVKFSRKGMKMFGTCTFRHGRRKVVQTWTGRRGRGELALKTRIFRRKFILRIEVRYRISRILWVDPSHWRNEKMRKLAKSWKKLKKLKKAEKSWLGPEKSWEKLKKAEKTWKNLKKAEKDDDALLKRFGADSRVSLKKRRWKKVKKRVPSNF